MQILRKYVNIGLLLALIFQLKTVNNKFTYVLIKATLNISSASNVLIQLFRTNEVGLVRGGNNWEEGIIDYLIDPKK